MSKRKIDSNCDKSCKFRKQLYKIAEELSDCDANWRIAICDICEDSLLYYEDYSDFGWLYSSKEDITYCDTCVKD